MTPSSKLASASPYGSGGTSSFDLKKGPLKAGVNDWRDPSAEISKIPLLTLFQTVEEKIIRMHEYDEIGTFDIDEFSQELLAIKRNYSAMIERCRNLLPEQDSEVRTQLIALDKELSRRRR